MIDTHMPMFKGNLYDLTINEKNLLYWMSFYNNNVFNLKEEERPSDFIINYDVLLDKWFEDKKFKEKMNRHRKTTPASEMQEVYRVNG